MLRLTVETKRAPAEVIRRATAYFGSGGLGLEAAAAGEGLSFTGAGGFVTVTLSETDGRTVVDLSTREFDDSIKKFAREIA